MGKKFRVQLTSTAMVAVCLLLSLCREERSLVLAMVATRCVVGCTNRHAPGCGIGFFQFAAAAEHRRMWISEIHRRRPDGKPWNPSANDRACSTHFVTGRPAKDPTHPDFAPSQKLGYVMIKKSSLQLSRLSRQEKFDSCRVEALANQQKTELEKQKKMCKLQEYVSHDHGYALEAAVCDNQLPNRVVVRIIATFVNELNIMHFRI